MSADELHSVRDTGVFRAVNISLVKRLICTFFIAWLALLSVGSQAYTTADAAHELSHLSVLETGGADVAESVNIAKAKADPAHGHDHFDTCGLSHCSHAHTTGVPNTHHAGLADAGSTAPLATLQPWDSRERPDSIERPKWVLTTPAVVNLLT